LIQLSERFIILEVPLESNEMIISELMGRVEKGLNFGSFTVYAKDMRACEMKSVVKMRIFIKDGKKEKPLFCMALFPGREPHYRPWIEIFCINNLLEPGTCYYDSSIEDALLEIFSRALGPGGKIYIEYLCDYETAYVLAMGYPPAATRQGYMLFKHGFTWFKDYYYSEGGHEGGQKLEGEKPLNLAAQERHIKNIIFDINNFLKTTCDSKTEKDEHEYLVRARERAIKVLNQIAARKKSKSPIS
jgi:hypothetical protein